MIYHVALSLEVPGNQMGLSDQNELYHILWDDLSIRVVTISIIILELYNKDNEKVVIGNIYSVLGTRSAPKF